MFINTLVTLPNWYLYKTYLKTVTTGNNSSTIRSKTSNKTPSWTVPTTTSSYHRHHRRTASSKTTIRARLPRTPAALPARQAGAGTTFNPCGKTTGLVARTGGSSTSLRCMATRSCTRGRCWATSKSLKMTTRSAGKAKRSSRKSPPSLRSQPWDPWKWTATNTGDRTFPGRAQKRHLVTAAFRPTATSWALKGSGWRHNRLTEFELDQLKSCERKKESRNGFESGDFLGWKTFECVQLNVTYPY